MPHANLQLVRPVAERRHGAGHERAAGEPGAGAHAVGHRQRQHGGFAAQRDAIQLAQERCARTPAARPRNSAGGRPSRGGLARERSGPRAFSQCSGGGARCCVSAGRVGACLADVSGGAGPVNAGSCDARCVEPGGTLVPKRNRSGAAREISDRLCSRRARSRLAGAGILSRCGGIHALAPGRRKLRLGFADPGQTASGTARHGHSRTDSGVAMASGIGKTPHSGCRIAETDGGGAVRRGAGSPHRGALSSRRAGILCQHCGDGELQPSIFELRAAVSELHRLARTAGEAGAAPRPAGRRRGRQRQRPEHRRNP